MLKYQNEKVKSKRKTLSSVSGKKKFKFKWWYVPIILVAVILIAAVIVYFVMANRVQANQNYANTFSSLPSQSLPQASSGSILGDDAFDNIKQQNYPIIKVPQKDPNVENILIIGSDARENDKSMGQRSDSMIVATINTKDNTLKLTSIMRDIKAYFPDLKSYNKINAAFAYGGAGQTVNIINYNFKLDIQKYIVVNFSGFENIIQAAGGVTIKVTSKEATQIPGLSGGGTYTLSGTQALAYSRIRHIDSDFFRVQRQRTVITALYSKFKSASLTRKASVANKCLDYVKTNIPSTELLGTMLNFTSAMNSNIAQYTVPQSDMYTSVSSPVYYINLNWDKQLPALSKFIWGK